jgi:non-canonical purine NTP pyrophosphatase (RdgB/HAM1 family)
MIKKNKILFATKNPGKLAEFKKAFDKLRRNYEVISFNDLPYDIPDCEETGTTFEENALLKAQNARRHLRGADTNMIVVADDSGMKIDYLNGEPGVFTRRWNGSEMSDDEIIDYCLEKLKEAPSRSASYVSCFAISTPRGKNRTIDGENLGVILEEPRADSKLKGMPFRSLFFVPELNMMFHEGRDLSKKERGDYTLGHEQAVRQIADYLDTIKSVDLSE